MTADEIIDVFIRSLNLINTDENGLTADNLPVDMEAIAQICPEIRAITAAGETPFQLALHRLAALTEQVVTTYVLPDRAIAKAWLIARGEVLELRLAGNC